MTENIRLCILDEFYYPCCFGLGFMVTYSGVECVPISVLVISCQWAVRDSHTLKVKQCFGGNDTSSSFVRYRNATLEATAISVIQFIDVDPQKDAPALTRIYPDGYTEKECLAQCTMNTNCYAIQAVYADETEDFLKINRNVEWCALLYVDGSGANITNRSSDWSNSAFSIIETWATTNAPSHSPLTPAVIQNDRANKPVAVLVKGNCIF